MSIVLLLFWLLRATAYVEDAAFDALRALVPMPSKLGKLGVTHHLRLRRGAHRQ
jgi:hypothetical protein